MICWYYRLMVSTEVTHKTRLYKGSCNCVKEGFLLLKSQSKLLMSASCRKRVRDLAMTTWHLWLLTWLLTTNPNLSTLRLKSTWAWDRWLLRQDRQKLTKTFKVKDSLKMPHSTIRLGCPSTRVVVVLLCFYIHKGTVTQYMRSLAIRLSKQVDIIWQVHLLTSTRSVLVWDATTAQKVVCLFQCTLSSLGQVVSVMVSTKVGLRCWRMCREWSVWRQKMLIWKTRAAKKAVTRVYKTTTDKHSLCGGYSRVKTCYNQIL